MSQPDQSKIFTQLFSEWKKKSGSQQPQNLPPSLLKMAYDLNIERLRADLSNIANDPSILPDVVQEAFLELQKDAWRWTPEWCQFYTFFYTIATRRALRFIKQNSASLPIPFAGDIEEQERILQILESPPMEHEIRQRREDYVEGWEQLLTYMGRFCETEAEKDGHALLWKKLSLKENREAFEAALEKAEVAGRKVEWQTIGGQQKMLLMRLLSRIAASDMALDSRDKARASSKKSSLEAAARVLTAVRARRETWRWWAADRRS